MYSHWPCVLFDVFLITNTTGIKNKENESKHYLLKNVNKNGFKYENKKQDTTISLKGKTSRNMFM